MGRPYRLRACLALMLAGAVAFPALAQQPGPRPTPNTPSAPAPSAPAPAPSAPAPSTGAAPKTGQNAQQAPQSPAPGSPAQPGNVKENHGAWSIICDKPAGASVEQCAMMQNVIAEDRPEVGLSVVVLKTADRKARILRILAPLGVLLKDGMELYVDSNNIGRAYFTRCFSEGCYVEVEIDDELMRILRAGKNAVFALRESADQDRVGIPIELNGFGPGYDALP
ncbi:MULTISPECIES: invasion associated locus B family protein [unclassified Rhizobium]|jgi:invasion protein IalB|uniref:invasion associated locus B family protein n=1 Tax=unclassified Rhizobium TaxID=2613769 RepID=UPI001FD94F11|nr:MULTISPECIES: invasion associated locus B family protein [unclassified Rhizobium]MBP2460261.1 invasion protein IalB [Rhizobium sp. PvP014]MBP2527658.1 invasion protein IalB [Rhizobium sp. PvP099]